MAALFVSHSSRDNERARELAAWLHAQGFESPFLDVDPESGPVAANPGERQRYARLRQCRAVIVHCSAHSPASRWCFAEVTQAMALGKSRVPARIAAGDVVPDILRQLQVVDLIATGAEAWQRLKRVLDDYRGKRIGTGACFRRMATACYSPPSRRARVRRDGYSGPADTGPIRGTLAADLPGRWR